MAEPLTITILTVISSVLGVGLKGLDFYKQVKANSAQSEKNLLVRLATAEKTRRWGGKDEAAKSIQQVYDTLAESKPFVTELYQRQIFSYAAAAAFVAFVLIRAFVYLISLPSLPVIGNPSNIQRTYTSFGWVFALLAFVMAWISSWWALPSTRRISLKEGFSSIKDLADGWMALRKRSAELLERTQAQFAGRPLLGLRPLSAFEATFLRAYVELNSMVRSLELQALYLQFGKSSEAIHDYLDDHVLAQIKTMLIAMVQAKVLSQKPQGYDCEKWQRDQREALKREFTKNGIEKYLEVVDPTFWEADFTLCLAAHHPNVESNLKSWFPSFSEK